MRLVSVTLKNFRCYLDEKTIQIGDLTTIIGRNDVGKSSILEALEIFFNNDTVKIDCEDCNVAAADRIIEITCEFEDPPAKLVIDAQAETSLADEHLLTVNGNLRIKKVFKCNTGSKPKEEVFVCANHPSVAQFNDLLELNNTTLKRRLKDLNIDEANVQLNSNPCIRHAIWRACPNLQPALLDIPVGKEDGKRIWEKLSENLPLFALFQSDRASRDSDVEVQDPMKLAIIAALSEPEIKEKLTDVVNAVKEKAVELAQRTQNALKKIDPDLAGQLTPEFKGEPKWPGLFSIVLNSDQGIPVNKRGSGVRRLILVSFFRAEAERRLEQGKTHSIIYAIEEPETSQHSHNQRILLESFQDLASEPNCQVILTTHSPGFASYLPIDSFRFIQKGEDKQPQIEATTNSNWESVVSALGVIPDNRVRVLICLEGPTDVTALKCLSHELHVVDTTIPDLSDDPRIAFVVLGGGTLTHWVNQHYLKELGRPEVHIYDSDVDKYRDEISLVNQRDDGSWGVQMSKWEIENYLHPDAIQSSLGLIVEFGDNDNVPKLVGEASESRWNPNTTKKKLARYAFPEMTAELIKQRDSDGEVESWLRRIGGMF